MAIAIGRLGGLGVIHRFLPIEQQALEVKKVKEEKLQEKLKNGINQK